jgi:deoxyribose-phosphate aldolase
MIENLNRYFDHALLNPETTLEQILKLCREAKKYNMHGIAINPFWVKEAKAELEISGVKIISVSGFPLSANRTDIKVAEAVKGIEDGADEIDMVANIGLIVMGEYSKVEQEILEIRRHLPDKIILKVIIEAPRLTSEAQIEATKAIINGGAQYVKTATGFFGGATIEMVTRLYKTADGNIKIKASGGIRTMADAVNLIRAGAERIGSSSSVSILEEQAGCKNRVDK